MAKSQRWRRFRKSNRTWDAPVLPIVCGLAGGLLAALTVSELEETARGVAAFAHQDSWAPVWAFLFGFMALGLPVLVVQKAALRTMRYVRALINARPYTSGQLLGVDLWAMDAVFAEHMLQLVSDRPGRIVELGSGRSTLLLAQRLEEMGTGHLTAVDHLEEFADRTRGWLEERGLGHRATVVHAPLADHVIDGRTHPWYDMDALRPHLPDRIDALVVDGPPGRLGKDFRWPAVPLLEDRLAPDARILLDDGDRPDETRIAHSWQAILGGGIRYLPGGKGGWLVGAD